MLIQPVDFKLLLIIGKVHFIPESYNNPNPHTKSNICMHVRLVHTRVCTRARTGVHTHDVEDALIKLGYVFKKTTARKSRRQCNSKLQEDMMTETYSTHISLQSVFPK